MTMDSLLDIKRDTHEARMERDGLPRCDECRDWSSDTEPVARMDADGKVTTRNLCGWCRGEGK